MPFIKYISNEQHYNEVLSLASTCKESLCIGTADIKDLYVKVGDKQEPFLMIMATLLKRGVDVMLIHAKEPGQAFREDFDKVWRGEMCNKCQRKQYCGDPIICK